MITLKPQSDDSLDTQNISWDDVELIDWSKVEIVGDPYDGSPVDMSDYSDIVDVSKIPKHRDAPNEAEMERDK